MLINLVDWLKANFGHFLGSGLFQYITFRAGVAIILSLIISLVLGGRIIKFLQKQQIGETIRELGLEGQTSKKGTPTMGGVLIVIPVLLITGVLNIANLWGMDYIGKSTLIRA